MHGFPSPGSETICRTRGRGQTDSDSDDAAYGLRYCNKHVYGRPENRYALPTLTRGTSFVSETSWAENLSGVTCALSCRGVSPEGERKRVREVLSRSEFPFFPCRVWSNIFRVTRAFHLPARDRCRRNVTCPTYRTTRHFTPGRYYNVHAITPMPYENQHPPKSDSTSFRFLTERK